MKPERIENVTDIAASQKSPPSSTATTILFAAFILNCLTTPIEPEAAEVSIPIAEQTDLEFPNQVVGRLGEKWQFPSDHLPVGVTINGIPIATWNVLDTDYIDWIYVNGQGLNHSLITEEDITIGPGNFTQRDQMVVSDVLSMIAHPTHPKAMIALQECGADFRSVLKDSLPENFKVIDGGENVILYDANLFDVKESTLVKNAFPSNPRPMQDVVLENKNTGEKFKIINAHVPGDPNGPGRYEFARYVQQNQAADFPTIALGDMNFDLRQMNQAFYGEAAKMGVDNVFHAYPAYYAHVGTNKDAKIIDHIYISTGKTLVFVEKNSPDQVMLGLQATVNLLNNYDFCR